MKQLIFFLSFFLLISDAYSQKLSDTVIPKPVRTQTEDGFFLLGKQTSISFNTPNQQLNAIANMLNKHLEDYYQMRLPVHAQKTGCIHFELSQKIDLPNDGYELEVNKKGIFITAKSDTGVFYGMQTLKQLIPVSNGDTHTFPVNYCKITDAPRFGWRGLHLDVCRHFFPVSFLKSYIDYMAMYKLNKFHLHLTDDQGWRIDIKKYPRLTEISSWRDETLIGYLRSPKGYDGMGYGGFYTQSQLKELVEYAKERYITIIPEIEMPGHSSAALAAYPEFGCTGGPYQVQTKWGVFTDIYCAGKENTFQFLEDVLDEVCAIFPSRYIHIGGDECPKDSWEKCPDCQKRIKEEGLKDEHELQSYFIQRIEKYLNAKGREIIGWDEILEGGLAPGATVMSWRGEKGGIEAAKAKHDVIMTPYQALYFDYHQSKDLSDETMPAGDILTIDEVYNYDPVPDVLASEEQHYVLGAQANVWTEYMPSTMKVEDMVFPRVCALAEVVWSSKSNKNFDDFIKRMDTEYKRLDQYGINYRPKNKAKYK